MSKQTRITIETDSLLILKGRSSRRAWCLQCMAEQEMIALENAGVVSNLDQAGVEAWLNAGGLHRLEDLDGTSLVCLKSLLASVKVSKSS